MKHRFPILLLLAAVAVFQLKSGKNWPSENPGVFSKPKNSPDLFPSDWFHAQRAWPQGRIDRDAVRLGLQQAQAFRANATSRGGGGWTFVGPKNVEGRISALAVHPSAPETVFVGSASGGVFKSTDGGVSFEPVFDDAPSLSIGDVVIAPSDPQVVFVGTGEPNGGGGSVTYDGMGVFKSTDGGQNWQPAGLENAGNIGKIAIDPQNPNRLYAAALGDLFGNSPQRGIFRSTDGGQNWQKTGFVSDSTGCIDLAIHPTNPQIIYAAMWERVRRPNLRRYGGPTSGIFRSTDGGSTWAKCVGGLPTGPLGRIGLAVSPARPEQIVAVLSDPTGYHGGVWRSPDAGLTWTRLDPQNILAGSTSGYHWWFGKIFVSPTDADDLFFQDIDMFRSTDGGDNWQSAVSFDVHVDHHALWIDPNNPAHILLGNDGGLYRSDDNGLGWQKTSALPTTQFYACELDEQHPERAYGGAQDNGTWRSFGANADDPWQPIFGGDGFQCLVNPLDNQYIYVEYQYGGLNRSTDGGFNFSNATVGMDPSDHKNWNCPIVFDPLDPATLYFGTNRLYKSTNHGEFWTPVSPDLTGGFSGQGGVVFGTLTTIAVSKPEPQTIWTGSDDGQVHVSKNGGATWQNVSAGLPKRWLTRLAADPARPGHAYVCVSGFRWHEYQPHVLTTADYGQTWQDISANLPELPVNDIVPDPTAPGRIFVATDAGVFVSFDGGSAWESLGSGLPLVPVTDLRLHASSGRLLAATYGRGMYAFDLQVVKAGSPKTPGDFSIQISPNPMRGEGRATVGFSEGHESVEVEILDAAGRRVRSLFRGKIFPGEKIWTLRQGDFPAAGAYVLSVRAGGRACFSKRFLVAGQ